MTLPSRQVLLGMIIGAFCASAVAAIGPGVVVQAFGDESPKAIDPAALVRFEDRDYDVQYEDWVATDPLSHTRVKKIEMGRVSYVDITTTATGTYSTDAMFSNHIQYPGITVEEMPRPAFGGAVTVLGGRGHWLALPLIRASSIIHLRTGKRTIVTDGRDTCVLSRIYTVC
jgi:hypothetical protein